VQEYLILDAADFLYTGCLSCHLTNSVRLPKILVMHLIVEDKEKSQWQTTYNMVVKLSSTRIISAASFDTSVPVFPIAMPMSALRRATASLTPSPVMPTTCPVFCSAYTHADTHRRVLCFVVPTHTDTHRRVPCFVMPTHRHAIIHKQFSTVNNCSGYCSLRTTILLNLNLTNRIKWLQTDQSCCKVGLVG